MLFLHEVQKTSIEVIGKAHGMLPFISGVRNIKLGRGNSIIVELLGCWTEDCVHWATVRRETFASGEVMGETHQPLQCKSGLQTRGANSL